MIAKRGRPPNPETRGKAVRLYLSAEANAALERLTVPGERSALVSRLILEEAARTAAEKR